jgi:hypothetical protein
VVLAVVIMTTEQPPVVIPPIHFPQGRNGVRAGIAELSLRRKPLPLTALLEPREARLLYAMTAVDHSGRIADRSVIRPMSWHSFVRLDVYEQGGLVVVRPDTRGSHAVNGRGFLLIPSAVRRWCTLGAGERVLLVADPAGQVLVLHPPQALDRVVGAAHAAAFGGDQS